MANNENSIIIVKSSFLCAFIICAISCNVSVLYVIKRYTYLQTVPNYFVATLAVTDLFYAVFGCTSIVITTIAKEWLLGYYYCNFIGLTNAWFCTVSIWTLIAISINRYIALLKPFRVDKIFTLKRTALIITGIWLLAFLFSVPPLFGWSKFVAGTNYCLLDASKNKSYAIILIFSNYVIPGIVLPYIYFKIHKIIGTQANMRKTMTNITRSDKSYQETLSSTVYDRHSITQNVFTIVSNKNRTPNVHHVTKVTANKHNDCDFKRLSVSLSGKTKREYNETKITKTLMLIVLAFFCCWTPFIVASILYAFDLHPKNFGLVTFGIVITTTNGVINPIIYGVRNHKFKKAFKDVYYRSVLSQILCCQKRQSSNVTVKMNFS